MAHQHMISTVCLGVNSDDCRSSLVPSSIRNDSFSHTIGYAPGRRTLYALKYNTAFASLTTPIQQFHRFLVLFLPKGERSLLVRFGLLQCVPFHRQLTVKVKFRINSPPDTLSISRNNGLLAKPPRKRSSSAAFGVDQSAHGLHCLKSSDHNVLRTSFNLYFSCKATELVSNVVALDLGDLPLRTRNPMGQCSAVHVQHSSSELGQFLLVSH